MDLARLWLINVIVALDAVDAQVSLLNDSHVIVLQEDHLVGVLDDGAGVRGEEVLDVLVGTERVELGLDNGGVLGAAWVWRLDGDGREQARGHACGG